LAERERDFALLPLTAPRRPAPRRAFDAALRFREPPDLRRAACARLVFPADPRPARREVAPRLTRLVVRERLAAPLRLDFLPRAAEVLPRGFDLPLRGIPIASRAVVEIGLPVAAAFPASAPTTPPTTAPIGPATLPTTAPVAAPTAGFVIGGIVMFLLGCSAFCSKLSVDSSGIAVPRFRV